MGQGHSGGGGVVQLPLVLDSNKDRDEEDVLQERLREAQAQSNEEYEEELLMMDRIERRARMTFRLHACKQKEVDTEGALKAMLGMIGIPPANDEEFQGWKRKYFDDPKMRKIDASEFVDFYGKLFKSMKMEVGAAYFALQEILKGTTTAATAAATTTPGGGGGDRGSRPPGGGGAGMKRASSSPYSIDPETLQKEFQRSLVADITASQVLDVVREIDTTGKDKIELRDFLVFMDANTGAV